MRVTPTDIPEVRLIEPDVFGDSRGFFQESWNRKRFEEFGLDVAFVQDNHSRSSRDVLRGLHYQLDKPQTKLVYVARGAVFDVAVDIRLNSPTFGKWVGKILSEDNHHQLFIPSGFAHGFCVLSDLVDFLYKCDQFYSPESEHGIRWDDPRIGIDWPGNRFHISEKDAANRLLEDMQDLPVYGA